MLGNGHRITGLSSRAVYAREEEQSTERKTIAFRLLSGKRSYCDEGSVVRYRTTIIYLSSCDSSALR
jgi:hypothetical protein